MGQFIVIYAVTVLTGACEDQRLIPRTVRSDPRGILFVTRGTQRQGRGSKTSPLTL